MKNTKFKIKEITSIESFFIEDIMVYNLTVDHDHSYTANNIIVHNCITSANSAVHYPMASLLYDINKVKLNLISYNKISENNSANNFIKLPKIVADGGCNNFDDIIKCLALGADYVMSGKIFAQSFESAAQLCANYNCDLDEELEEKILNKSITYDYILQAQSYGIDFEKVYYGMSTKRAQSEMGNEELKTSEGIEIRVPLLYTLAQWTENFIHYLRSAMSYCDANELSKFHPKTIQISQQALSAYYK